MRSSEFEPRSSLAEIDDEAAARRATLQDKGDALLHGVSRNLPPLDAWNLTVHVVRHIRLSVLSPELTNLDHRLSNLARSANWTRLNLITDSECNQGGWLEAALRGNVSGARLIRSRAMVVGRLRQQR